MSSLTIVLLCFGSLVTGYAAGLRSGRRKRRGSDQRGPGHRVVSDRRPVVR